MLKIISHTPKKVSLPKRETTHEPYFALTCQSGLESLVKRECEKLGGRDIEARDRLVKCSGEGILLYKLLIGSRFTNRVYLCLDEARAEDFDTLFSVCEGINWGNYLSGKERIVIEWATTKSKLTSIPTIQSIAQKAIFSTLVTPNTTNGTEVHVLILIIDDIAHILLDVTGDPLHKRGYRTESGDAPIKENLAAALVAFANWKYSSPLLDPFCGSGTIAIEAAMIARNIAPGLMRHFRIEELPCYQRDLMDQARTELRSRAYPSGKYTIHARDIDMSVIEKARRNAERAWVSQDIVFEVGNFLEWETSSFIVSNPPYGNRLQSDELEDIYKKLVGTIERNGGGFISSHPIFAKGLANKKLLNGWEECRFWYKKS